VNGYDNNVKTTCLWPNFRLVCDIRRDGENKSANMLWCPAFLFRFEIEVCRVDGVS
jgi:hypothetical protein